MRDFVSELKTLKKTTANSLLDIEVVEKIRNSKTPILLWGCGIYAEYIYKILKSHNIKIHDVFIDNKSSKLTFHEFEVFSFDEMKKNILE